MGIPGKTRIARSASSDVSISTKQYDGLRDVNGSMEMSISALRVT